ncbi:sodium-dependent multivitamin transporter-like [Anneissia japonica]|uniref:sodium-dependent multivitamin transporter-like n=1 Tax=Anneissia japonica TaxID=1529436 RepID=UPI0014256538|nr:sodium-dependent multivitamin transporter-like [Anneissia japonica]
MTSAANPLGVLDFVVISVMLVIAAATGIYHGFVRGGQQTTSQFLVADRSMFSLPIAMTLLASFISPVTLLGTPAEIYVNGGQYMMFVCCHLLLYPSIAFIFIPVFHGLSITSAYQYLYHRFGTPLEMLGAGIFMFQTSFYIAIVLFTPALAVEAVTNFAFWKTILIGGVVCTFYTSLGGMKAVIWTDVFMFIVIFATTMLVVTFGTIEAGGIDHIIESNLQADRLDMLQFPGDLTARMSFLSLTIGGWMNAMPLWAISQTAVQRFLTARTVKDAQVSVLLNIPMVTIIILFVGYQGLVLFTFYDDMAFENTTDMINTTVSSMTGGPNITKSDQIMVYFISEQFGHIPGFQGLFIACLWAGTLSTVSSGLNAMIAVTLEDVIKPIRRNCLPHLEVSDATDTKISKILTILFGAMTIGLGFLATKMGSLVNMANSIFGAAGGPLLAAFTLGMFWKRANSRGTLIGVLISFFLGVTVSVGAAVTKTDPDAPSIFKLSFMWYATFTWLVAVFIAVPASELIRLLDPTEQTKVVDYSLLIPFLRPKLVKTTEDNGVRMEFKKLDQKIADI